MEILLLILAKFLGRQKVQKEGASTRRKEKHVGILISFALHINVFLGYQKFFLNISMGYITSYRWIIFFKHSLAA